MARRTRQLDRQQIVDAARVSLAEHGEPGLSLRRLARTLGVTAPALYLYVSSKQELMQAVADAEFGTCIHQLQAIGAREGDPLDRIKAQANTYVRWAAEHPDLFRALFLVEPALASTRAGEQMSLAARAFAALARPVSEAVGAGRIHDANGLDAATAVWTAIHGAATAVVTRMVDASWEMMIEGVVEATLFGLATESLSLGRSRA